MIIDLFKVKSAEVTDLNHEEFLEREEQYLKEYIGVEDNEGIQKYRDSVSLEQRKSWLTPNWREVLYRLKLSEEASIYVNNLPHIIEAKKREEEQLLRMFQKASNRSMEKILSGDDDRYPQFKSVTITREAYEKANKIAKRVVDVSNRPNEVYFYLLNEGNNDEMKITDVYVPHQEVDPTFCRTSNEFSAIDFRTVENMGKKPTAWGHSHGHFSTFHSSTDERNLKTITNLYGTKKDVEVTDWSVTPLKINTTVMPSIVFNAKGEKPYVELVTEYRGFCTDDYHLVRNKNPVLNIIDEDNGISMDDDEMDKYIFERVKPRTGFKRWFNDITRLTESGDNQEEIHESRQPDIELETSEDYSREPTTNDYNELLKEMVVMKHNQIKTMRNQREIIHGLIEYNKKFKGLEDLLS